MIGALNKCVFHIKKPVFQPFQAGTGVWTAIDVRIKLAIPVHNEDVVILSIHCNLESLAAGVWYI